MVDRFIPAIEEQDRGWRALVEENGIVFPAITSVGNDDLVTLVRRQFLRPNNINGVLTTMLQDSNQELIGWIVLASSQSNTALLREYRSALCDLSATASERIDSALGLAEELGAVWPTPLPQEIRALSARELQVAKLAAQGLSDLNIAARLNVSESTIGSHMYRIYKRLRIHNRVELVQKMTATMCDI